MTGALATVVDERSITALLASAHERLALAMTLDEVVAERDVAELLRDFAHRRHLSVESQVLAYKHAQRCAYRLGQITRELPRAKPGPKATEVIVDGLCNAPLHVSVSKGQALAAANVSRMQASRAERLVAELTPEQFEVRLQSEGLRMAAGKPVRDLSAMSANPKHASDEWGTPAEYVTEVAPEVFGRSIACDVASNDKANEIVRADHYFTKDRSSLDVAWDFETIWWQPPFSGELILAFAKKLEQEWAAHRFRQLIGLSNIDSSTEWWKCCASCCSAIVLPEHRIAFLENGVPRKGNEFCQWFFYVGPEPDRFLDVYSQFGAPFTPATLGDTVLKPEKQS